MYCQRCGKELAAGAAYCQSCGAKVGESSPADWRWTWRRERWERRDWEPVDAAWGAISGVGYLIIIGLMIFWYPDVFTLLVKYLESWGTYGHPVLPGHALGQAIIFLFTASGVWGVLSSGGRLALTSRVVRPLRGVVGGLFSLYVAFILSSFYAKSINGAGLVLAFFVGLAAMIVTNALISFFLPRRRTPKQMSTS
ncbi:MAG TPA: zinc ribbon domain-containing protein [Nitrososphaerales archaeon]|nr:zinc ribbon domain-containing protein [Nitrososphaerales archaeon]